MALSGAEILTHTAECPTREVHIPAWKNAAGDDVVIVRGMTVREFELQQSIGGKGEGKSSARLVARCALDVSGGRLFKDEQIDSIAELPLAQMMTLTNAISVLSGLAEEDDEDKPKTGDGAADEPAKDEAEPGKSPTLSSAEGSSSELHAISG